MQNKHLRSQLAVKLVHFLVQPSWFSPSSHTYKHKYGSEYYDKVVSNDYLTGKNTTKWAEHPKTSEIYTIAKPKRRDGEPAAPTN